MADVDFYLKIDGVDGESADGKHKGELDIESYSWGVTNQGSSSHGGGAGAGKAHVQDFSFTKRIDKSSPVLMQACASGKHFAKAVFTARKAGGDQVEYLKFTFTDVLISSYQQAGPANGPLVNDAITFNCSKVEMAYSPQAATGSKEGDVSKGWDIKKNEKV